MLLFWSTIFLAITGGAPRHDQSIELQKSFDYLYTEKQLCALNSDMEFVTHFTRTEVFWKDFTPKYSVNCVYFLQ